MAKSTDHPNPTLPATIRCVGGICAVAAVTHINPRTVKRWEDGEFPCPPEVLALLESLATLRTGQSFKVRLKQTRMGQDLSQAQAVAAISPVLPVRTLQTWELGTQSPPEWSQELILAALVQAGKDGKSGR